MRSQLKLYCVLLAIFFSFFSCNQTSEKSSLFDLTAEERVWMENFFRGIMIQEGAVYTLFGSKPMTKIYINYYTEEEKKNLINEMSKEQKENAIWCTDYRLADNWEKWMQIRQRFQINRYLLFKKQSPNNAKLANLYFVDIVKLATVLQEHYELFSRETGMDFDPLEVVFEIEQGSEFWDEVFEKSIDNAALTGILFGYGIKNAFCFQWKHCPSLAFEKVAGEMDSHLNKEKMLAGDATIDHLLLPSFVSFFDEDEMIEKYTKERERIKKNYRGKDFLDTTMRKLTGN
jgi:hypothetical protein